jgi:hypothetical protein
MRNRHSTIKFEYEDHIQNLYIIGTAMKEMIKTSCLCEFNSLKTLLLTCKKLNYLLPLNREKCTLCKYDILKRRECKNCYVCTWCKFVFCIDCRKLGTLQCKKCTCTGCGQSENFTGMHPGFQGDLCYNCASDKYGSNLKFFRKAPNEVFFFKLLNKFEEEFEMRCQKEIIAIQNKKQNILLDQQKNITIQNKKQYPMIKYQKQYPIIRYQKQYPIIRYQKQSSKRNQKSNHNVRYHRQIQQRNSKK